MAIELSHRGAHPGRCGIERRLRNHFFFHDMFYKVHEFVKSCRECSMFVDKKTKEPLDHHQVPLKCWQKVAVDLFGPMPSNKHIVVVHDLSSRYPAAKIVASTKAEKVLPALADIYETFGHPDIQISDNGPPFNGQAMKEFADKRDISLQFAPPRHPNANPTETCMKPIGKAVKAACSQGNTEQKALSAALRSYRQTPHIATGIAPSAMLFRDGVKDGFPRAHVTEEQVVAARANDHKQKQKKQEQINQSKYRAESNFVVGEHVLVRNYKKHSKFDPMFIPEPFRVTDIHQSSKTITIRRENDGLELKRHPDDLKRFHGSSSVTMPSSFDAPYTASDNESFFMPSNADEDDAAGDSGIIFGEERRELVEEDAREEAPRRSTRERIPNQRYVNDSFVND